MKYLKFHLNCLHFRFFFIFNFLLHSGRNEVFFNNTKQKIFQLFVARLQVLEPMITESRLKWNWSQRAKTLVGISNKKSTTKSWKKTATSNKLGKAREEKKKKLYTWKHQNGKSRKSWAELEFTSKLLYTQFCCCYFFLNSQMKEKVIWIWFLPPLDLDSLIYKIKVT